MKYYQINYDKLKKLKQINYFIVIFIIILLISFLIILSGLISINKKITCYGIMNNGLLTIEIENSLSDKIKANNTLKFNDQKMSYQVISYGDYRIVDNVIIQSVNLAVDEDVFDNEVGEVNIYYGKQKIIAYILDLFK